MTQLHPLSRAQQRIWYSEVTHPGTVFASIGFTLRLPSADSATLDLTERVVNEIAAKNQSLRTRLVVTGNDPYADVRQYFAPPETFHLARIAQPDRAGVNEAVRLRLARPFLLEHAQLWDAAVYTHGENEATFFLRGHHIAVDGISLNLIGAAVANAVFGVESGPDLAGMLEHGSNYTAFLEAEQEYLASPRYARDGEYWLKTLENPPDMALIADGNAESDDFRCDHLLFELDPDAALEAGRLCRSLGANPFRLTALLFHLVVARWSRRDDTVFHIPFSNRGTVGRGFVGMCVETVPVRFANLGALPLKKAVDSMGRSLLRALSHGKYPYQDIVAGLRDSGGYAGRLALASISDTGLTQDAEHVNAAFVHGGDGAEPLTMYVNSGAGADALHTIHFRYRTDIFSRRRMERLVACFRNALDYCVRNPETRLDDIPLASPEEESRILDVWNRTDADFGGPRWYPAVFREAAARYGDRTAAVFGGVSRSYRELDEDSDRLARGLGARGVAPGDFVPILLERSVDILTAEIGVMKAGAAFVPIDPGYPPKRIETMLENCAARVVLDRACFDDIMASADTDAPLPVGSASDLAYMLYTSGSTGTPKGVLIEHAGLVNLIEGKCREHHFDEADRVGVFHSVAFDVSVFHLLAGLTRGAAIHVLDDECRTDAEALGAYVRAHRITRLHLPTKFGEIFCAAPQSDSLKTVWLGGEALTKPHPIGGTAVYNSYGPTETTIHATEARIDDFSAAAFPIGRPLANVRAVILDDAGRLCPPGMPGELCLSGIQVARGYHRLPEETAKRFVANPHYRPGRDPADHARMYRTGDLAYWREDGQIGFIGRRDAQVKIRGFRIELGDIEAALASHPAVAAAAVVVKPDLGGQTNLVAYYVPKDGAEPLGDAAVKTFLAESLPSYMIPSHCIRLEEMPLSANGKADRRRLPEPVWGGAAGFIPPATEAELLLAEIWREVLGSDSFGVGDNFFVLGGDSIKAIQVQAKLRGKGFAVSTSDMFRHPTIRALGPLLKELRAEADQGPLTGDVALTPIQRRLFAHTGKADHFHQSVGFRFRPGMRVNEDVLKRALAALVEKHDMLRAVFLRDADAPFARRQTVRLPDAGNLFQIHRIARPDDFHVIQAAVDIGTGPMLHAAILEDARGDEVFLAIHHLVVDGVSWRILIEDLNTAYVQLERGEPVRLPAKSDSFRQWSEALRARAETPALLREAAFWRKQQDRCAQAGALPLANPLASGQRLAGLATVSRITVDDAPLRAACSAYHAEVNDLLLAALVRAVGRWGGGDAVAVTLEGHGRERSAASLDVSRTVGWFTCTYPVVFPVCGGVGDQIIEVKETLRQIPGKGVGYDILRYLTDALPVPAVEPPILFNYLGSFGFGDDGLSLTPARFGAGQDVGPGYPVRQPLSCNAMTLGDRLHFDFGRVREELGDVEFDRFAALFSEALDEIVRHCAELAAPVRTPSDYGDATLTRAELAAVADCFSLDSVQRILPLTPMQEGMLFHSQVVGAASAYFQQSLAELRGPLDLDALRTRLDAAVARHDLLRAACIYENVDSPRLVVLASRQARFYFEDLRELTPAEQKAHVDACMHDARQRGLDVTRDALFGLSVFATGPDRHLLAVDFHHLIMDRWSLALLLDELFGAAGEETPPLQFGDYVDWLRARDRDADLLWWKNVLGSVEEQTDLPGRVPIPDGESEPDRIEFDFGPGMLEQLNRLAGQQQVTPNTVLQAAWGVLLQLYNNRRDVVFGGVVSGRTPELPGCGRMVGMCVNTIPVRVTCDADAAFSSLLAALQRQSLDADSRAFCSLADLFTLAPVGNGLITHLFVMENIPLADGAAAGPELVPLDHFSRTNYDLSLVLEPAESLRGFFGFNAAAFPREQIERFRDHYRIVLQTVLDNPDVSVSDIEILLGDERTLVLETFNATDAAFEPFASYVDMFRRSAATHAESPAVVFVPDGEARAEFTLSYREVDEASDRLAARLRAEGVGPDVVVPIMLPRCAQFPVCALGVMKAGGAYLPIDPDYPTERIEYMLADSGAALLLAFEDMEEKTACFAGAVVPVPRRAPASTWWSGAAGVQAPIEPAHLAYQIYTSGSTGNPKGVMLEHAGLVNLIQAKHATHRFGPDDRVAVFHSFSFDVSVFHLFAALAYGGTVHVLSESRRHDVDELQRYVADHGITRIHLPTRVGELFCETPHPAPLKTIWLGGEALKQVGRQDAQVWNSYGPTETTVHVTEYRVEDFWGQNFPIGKPLANCRAYILGLGDKPCPIGIPGELCFSGIQVGRGYRNNPETTAAKFVDNPLYVPGRDPAAHRRMYRTGDVCSWLPDGNIRFIGRNDFQMKIRGFRVEPGEVEELLGLLPFLEEKAVVGRKGLHDAYYLAAYYTLADFAEKETPEQRQTLHDAVKQYLSYFLPDFMVPQYLVELEEMPRTPTGKIDRSLLPPPEATAPPAHCSASTPDEKRVAAIWGELFGQDDPDVRTDFLAMGGQSLLAMRLLSRLKAKLGLHVGIADLYDGATIASLAAMYARAQKSDEENPFRNRYLNPRGAGTLLIFLPPVTGAGLCYLSLVGSLGKESPLLLLNQHGHEQGQTPETDIPAVAMQFGREIDGMKDERPCFLVGWSLGGLFAFETARYLLRSGRKVKGLVCIDTRPVFQMQSRELFERWSNEALEKGGALPPFFSELEPLLKDDPSYRVRLRHLVKNNLAAHEHYRPAPLTAGPLRMLLIQAGGETPGMGGKDLVRVRREWEMIGGLAVQSCDVAGANHFDIVTEPHCRRVAEMIRGFVEEVEKS